jgi:hypothetical protein
MEKGMEVGAKQGKIEVAKNAIREGMELGLIEKLTGLPKKEIVANSSKQRDGSLFDGRTPLFYNLMD